MTEAERAALREFAANDFKWALHSVRHAWFGSDVEPTADALQAGAATLLIHLKHLRESSHRAAAQPTTVTAAPKRGQGNPEAPASAVAVPPCPACGGPMWDNRTNKKNPKAADFTCKQKNGECKNEAGYKTGVWLKDLAKNGAKGAASPKPTESYDEMPVALGDAAEDDLPF